MAGRETILVVEDEEIVRLVICQVLVAEGYQVIEAEGPDQGLDALRSCDSPVDLLLTDVVMPGMNGEELAHKLVEIQPSLKVLFTSGFPDDVGEAAWTSSAQSEFLQKPFAPAALASKVRELLAAPHDAVTPGLAPD